MHRRRAFGPPLTINRMIPQEMVYIVEIEILDHSMNSSRVEDSVFGVQKRRVGRSGKPTYLHHRITTTSIIRRSRNEWLVYAEVK